MKIKPTTLVLLETKTPFLRFTSLACLILAGATAHAAVIASDTFTGKGDGTPLVGTPLETSLSGGGWVTQFGNDSRSFRSTTSTSFGNPLPGSFGNNGQSVSAVSIASAGAYVKPTILFISADLAPAPTGFTGAVGAASAGRGIALGFYSSLSSSTDFSQNRFTGLVLDAAGNLNLVHDPNATGFFGGSSVRGTPVAFGGTWDASILRRLSYTVNTTTGAISDISLEGSSASYSFATTLFTDAATNLAGAYVSSESGATFAAMDNFVVIPEPSSVVSLGGLGMICFLRRRRA